MLLCTHDEKMGKIMNIALSFSLLCLVVLPVLRNAAEQRLVIAFYP